jgi:CHAD domain-containing protein
LRAAAERYPPAGADAADRVHDARKELKRAASLARLFAPIVGAPAYRALDAVDAARRWIGRARDLDALQAALAGIKCGLETREILIGVIVAEREAARGEHAEIGARFGPDLLAAADALAEWRLEAGDGELLHSLRQTYRSAKRRGRAAFSTGGRAAFSTGDADDLHDLRSRVVDLAHQCALCEPAWPAMFVAHGEELQRLRQALGDHNDLTMLGEFALARHELPAPAAETLVELVLRKRKRLETRARVRFERAFAERPGAFARRISAYLAHPQIHPRAEA